MDRCSLCPGKNKCIGPSGPFMKGKPLYIGEAPGYLEDRKGEVFIGKTGMELRDGYFPLAGVRDPTICNAILCLPDRPKGKLDLNREKDKDLLLSCATAHLYKYIEELEPSLIVPMGAFACYALDPDIRLDLHHGIPLQTQYGTVFPMWHPSGGIHEPKKMLQIRTDWIRLKRFLRDTLVVAEDLYPHPDYSEVTDSKEINELDPTCSMACDTESSRRLGPYCLTYSQQAGTGRLIRAERKDLLLALQRKLYKWEDIIIWHNWLYDWNIVEQMGLEFKNSVIRDTMVTAYNLANLPQGLKVLAYRLLGIEMQDFEDLVKPYSTEHVLDYYRAAYRETWNKPEEQLLKQDDGKWRVYKPQSLKTKLRSLFTRLNKGGEVDLFKVWDTWGMHQAELEERVGPYPGMDIRHTPEDAVLRYACRDADATLRLWPVLQKMKLAAMSGKLQEQWEL